MGTRGVGGRFRRLPRLTVLAVTIGVTLLAVIAGSAIGPDVAPVVASTELVAAYQLNENSWATVMADSGPYGLDGTIGSDIITGATYDGATGYRWRFASPTAPPPKPGRIANVPTSGHLNPGTADFAVEFRYRTTHSFGNVVQKGQNASTGGYFKFQQPFGLMTCLFKDVNGVQMAVQSNISTKDGEWHVVRCELRSGNVWLKIDDENWRTSTPKNLASISNTRPLSVGGKSDCDQIEITCDYFTGDIDDIRFEKALPTPPTTTTTTTTTIPATTTTTTTTTTSTTTTTTSTTTTTTEAMSLPPDRRPGVVPAMVAERPVRGRSIAVPPP